MVWCLFSQGGASLTLGYYILPFQGNTPTPQEQRVKKRKKGYGVLAQRKPRKVSLRTGVPPARYDARK